MIKRFAQSWRWSKIVDLYFDRKHGEFLKAMDAYASDYKLTDYEKVVVANAKLLVGNNDEAKNEFIRLALEINSKDKPYLSLYCRASIADIENNKAEYRRLVVQAQEYCSTRFERTLPLTI